MHGWMHGWEGGCLIIFLALAVVSDMEHSNIPDCECEYIYSVSHLRALDM